MNVEMSVNVIHSAHPLAGVLNATSAHWDGVGYGPNNNEHAAGHHVCDGLLAACAYMVFLLVIFKHTLNYLDK